MHPIVPARLYFSKSDVVVLWLRSSPGTQKDVALKSQALYTFWLVTYEGPHQTPPSYFQPHYSSNVPLTQNFICGKISLLSICVLDRGDMVV